MLEKGILSRTLPFNYGRGYAQEENTMNRETTVPNVFLV